MNEETGLEISMGEPLAEIMRYVWPGLSQLFCTEKGTVKNGEDVLRFDNTYITDLGSM